MQNTSITEQNYKSLFAWDNFKRLDKSEREELIRFSIEQIRTEKGLKKVDVEFFSGDPSSRGSCSQDFKGKKCVGHIINLNDDILTEGDDYYSPYRMFNTINHELEHASQYEHASNGKIKNSDPATLEQRLNDQHYYSAEGDRLLVDGNRMHRFDAETDYQLYRAQACEADARAAGYAAVESLKTEGKEDIYLDSYLKTEKAREINNNKRMMNCLGMHSREEMAKEELSYISTKKVNEQDRQKVLEYARQKDYETAKEVLQADSHGQISEEEIKARFDNDRGYSNFYESKEYQDKKVNESSHPFYSYANYKWEENGEINDEIDIDTDEITRSQGESPHQKNSVIGDGMKKAMLWAYLKTHDPIKAYDNGYKTVEGYNASRAAKGAVRIAGAITHNPSLSSDLSESVESSGHAYDEYWAAKHPDEVISFTERPIPQEIIDKNTLVITDIKDPYGSVVKQTQADEVISFTESSNEFFKSIDEKSEKIDMKSDENFFVRQEEKLSAGNELKEDRSFFERIDEKADKVGQKVDEKLEEGMQTAARVISMSKGQKQ